MTVSPVVESGGQQIKIFRQRAQNTCRCYSEDGGGNPVTFPVGHWMFQVTAMTSQRFKDNNNNNT